MELYFSLEGVGTGAELLKERSYSLFFILPFRNPEIFPRFNHPKRWNSYIGDNLLGGII